MILVLVDHDRGEIDPLSLRALTAARTLGHDVEAIVIGSDGVALAAIAGEYVQSFYTLHPMLQLPTTHLWHQGVPLKS